MGKGENSKKAAGNAKKAEAAAAKQAAKNAEVERDEDAKWAQGSKSNAKKEAAADKAAEAARKKAEKAALAAEEEASLPKTQKQNKSAAKKGPSKGTLDLGKLDALGGDSKGALNASGIDNALDALSLANSSGTNDKIDRHPERRFKAAYTQFEERRLDEMKDEKGLRRQQKIDQIRKEFEKSPDNPFNQAFAGRYDMSKEEMQTLRDKEREAMENRLAGN